MRQQLALLLSLTVLFAMFAPLQSEPLAKHLIGQSNNGYPLEVYRFGSGWRRVIFVGGIHGGYERNTVELAWQLIEYFQADPTLVPQAVTLEIIPVANPDGLAKVMGAVDRKVLARPAIVRDAYVGRFNANNVDLNRNWDCDWRTTAQGPRGNVSGGSSPMSELETQLLAAYLAVPSVAGVVFWHSSANGVYAGGCEDDFPAAQQLAQRYASASGYPLRTAFSAYPISGDATNWLALQGIPAITIELRSQSSPEFEQNLRGVRAVLAYFSNASTHCNPIQTGHRYVQSTACKTWLQP